MASGRQPIKLRVCKYSSAGPSQSNRIYANILRSAVGAGLAWYSAYKWRRRMHSTAGNTMLTPPTVQCIDNTYPCYRIGILDRQCSGSFLESQLGLCVPSRKLWLVVVRIMIAPVKDTPKHQAHQPSSFNPPYNFPTDQLNRLIRLVIKQTSMI